MRTKPVNARIAARRTFKSRCDCATHFVVRLAREGDYAEWKRVFDRGRHPAFLGRGAMTRNARNGGALFYDYAGEPIAASLVNPRLGILLALNVLPAHRGHGLGAAIVQFLMPNFARVIESKIPWFERQGYKCIGGAHHGISLNSQVMVRSALISLVGNLQKAWK